MIIHTSLAVSEPYFAFPADNTLTSVLCPAATAAPILGPASLSRVHLRESYHVLDHLGSGCHGDTYVACSKLKTVYLINKHGLGTDAFYNALRENLVVAKFAKDNDSCRDAFKDEIKIMTQTMPASHPNVIRCLDFHADDKINWLVLPLCTEGSLNQFQRDHDYSVAFIWHCGLQVAKSILFLHFGIRSTADMTPVKGWPSISHNDIFLGNVFVQGIGPYHLPNIVLTDFGAAEQLAGDKTSRVARAQHLQGRIDDFRAIGDIMAVLLEEFEERQSEELDRCTEWVYRFASFDVVGDESAYQTAALTFLSSFVRAAEYELAQSYGNAPVQPADEIGVANTSNEALDYALGLCACGATLPQKEPSLIMRLWKK